jgi:hypothetical protein
MRHAIAPALPEVPLSEVASHLRIVANVEARTNQNLEVFIARLGDEASPAIKSVLADGIAHAERLALLVEFIEALATREGEVRALFQSAPKEVLKHAVG